MDFSGHNDELAFKLQLRQQLTRKGLGFVMGEVVEEIFAMATFLEESEDTVTAERYREAGDSLIIATDSATQVLQESEY